MHLLDITTARSSSQNHIFTQRAQSLLHNKFLFGNDKRLAFRWKSFQVLRKDKEFDAGRLELKQSGLLIRAVATLEQILSARINGGHVGCDNLEFGATFGITRGVQHECSSEEFEEVDEKEKLRRMRISKANKGNTPWNKGRKHSAETLQRIKERTRIAMQNPKVKMKLVNLGHAQSKETRVKIGVGVRMGWERRREKLKLQETCYFEWQNLLADASRRGFADEKELQWDSYKILDKQLEQEWLESVDRRKRAPRPKGSKRAPKSLEQRRKISEAISAKWADPGYRDRVYSALSKYYGTPVGVERKPRRRQSGERQARIQTLTKKKAKDADRFADNMTMRENPCTKLGRSNVPLYKDPLASSKLEMIKNIRAQRAAAELKKTEAIKQAKLLIAEAEKAVKGLEATAMKSPLAQASLIESRELIAEAIQSLQSIENGQIDAEHGKNPSVDKEKSPIVSGVSQTDHGEINGFGKPNLLGFINGKEEEALVSTRFKVNGLLYVEKELLRMGTVDDLGLLSPSEVRDRKEQFTSFTEQLHQIGVKGKNSCEEKLSLPNGAQVNSNEKGSPLNSVTKKWVRGRLVEIVEKE